MRSLGTAVRLAAALRIAAVVALVGAGAPACGGGNAPPNIDAHPGGPLCSKQLFDLCREEHDCDLGLCMNFGDFQVCSQACIPDGDACPDDKTGAPATCENGACKPSAPNMCHLPGQ